MISKKIIGITAGSVIVGASQTALLREYVDKPMAKSFLSSNPASGTPGPFLMKTLGNFGSPSAFIGLVSGGAAAAIGTYGAIRDKPIRDNAVNLGLVSYGVTAASTGFYSGMFPTTEWSSAVATDPSNPVFSGFGRKKVTSFAGQGKFVESVPAVNAY